MPTHSFGTLRSLMQKPALDDADRERLWKLIKRARAKNRKQFDASWLPYMQSFSRHYRGRLLKLTSTRELKRAAKFLPGALFELEENISPGWPEYGIPLDLSYLSQNPALEHVSRLTISLDIQDRRELPLGEGITEIASWTNTTNLRALNLPHDTLRDADIERLCHALELPLRELGLHDNTLGAAGVETIARADVLSGLERLDLSRNTIGTQGAQALASHRTFSNLEWLDLAHTDVGTHGVIALAQSTNLSHVTWLDLTACDVGVRGAVALAESPHTSSLRHLELQRSSIGDAGARALIETLNLHHLGLRSCAITDDGARAIASSEYASSLESLDLRGNPITPEGIRALLDSPHLSDAVKVQLRASLSAREL